MNFEEFKREYQHVPIEDYPNNVPDDPIVSVCVQTYQHVDYIEDCLEGILMQETDFSFEILLGEDASTDGTREICIEYAKKYPEKIRLFLHERENNIEIGGQPSGRFNFLYNLYSARGKYIALCEGDDYWTDPLKLQKQVEFMEANEEYGLVYTKAKRIYNNAPPQKNVIGFPPHSQGLLLKKYSIPTLTVLFSKKNYKEYVQEVSPLDKRWAMGDYPLWLWIEENSKIHFIPEITATYRVLEESASHSKDKRKQLKFHSSVVETASYFAKKYLNKEEYVKFLEVRYFILYKFSMLNDLKNADYFSLKLKNLERLSFKTRIIIFILEDLKLRSLYKFIRRKRPTLFFWNS